MDFSEVVRKRRMVRDFDPRPLPAETVDQILTNSQHGPSSGFTQGFEFIVFEGPDQTQKFWESVPWWNKPNWDGARKAPLVIIPLSNESAYVAMYSKPDKAHYGRKTGEDFPSPYWYIDTAFAAMLILLSAVDAGLGGFYFSIGPSRREIPRFCETMGIPNAYYPIGAIAIGYPAEDLPPQSPILKKRRRNPEDMIHLGGW